MINQAKRTRYPVLSTKAILLISLPVLVTITILVFALSDRSVFVETQITLLVIALCLFTFLTAGLYHGVRLERPDRDQLDRAAVELESRSGPQWPGWSDFANFFFLINPADLPRIEFPQLHLSPGDLSSSDVGDDLVGCLVSIVVWIAILLLLTLLLWMLAQVIAALPVILLALCWIFYRALRLVFAKSRTCRGHLLPSMGYGLLYTILYVGWIFALLWIGRLLIV